MPVIQKRGLQLGGPTVIDADPSRSRSSRDFFQLGQENRKPTFYCRRGFDSADEV